MDTDGTATTPTPATINRTPLKTFPTLATVHHVPAQAARPLANRHEIRRRRVKAHLQQKDLARAVGISACHICNIEAGRRNPSPRLLYEIAQVLNCTPADLLTQDFRGPA
jgi:DNA-binding XRE family transcriptional regulator